jgi:hypothetical protein
MNTPELRLNSRKRLAILVSVVLTAALVLTGTFAWVSLGERGTNRAMGEPGPAGGRLHDDYEVVGASYGVDEWTDNLTANKDIYVENYETAANGGRPLFVRLKLYEYMEIGAGATELPQMEDPANPGTFIDNPAYATRAAKSLVDGASRDDESTWSARVPGMDIISDQFRNRWQWTQGGQKTYMPTFNKDNMSQETDIKGDASDSGSLATTEQMNTTKRGGSNEYAHVPDPASPSTPAAGDHNYFETVTTWDAPEKYWDDDANSGAGEHTMGATNATHTSKPTIDGGVITMEQWKAAPYSGAPGNFWVVDTDGWAYWANPLEPETATGLLLDSITLQGSPDDEWFYGIHVRSEMATAADWTAEAEGGGFYANAEEQPSEDAKALLNIITGRLPKVVGVSLDKTLAAVNVDGALNLKVLDVITENTNDTAYKAVTWSINPSVGTRFTSNGSFSPSGQDAGKWYTIRATSVKDPSVYGECKVYVPQVNQGVLEGADGNVYMYHVDNNDNTFQQVLPDGTLGPLICPAEVGKPGYSTDKPVTVIGGGHYLDIGDGKNYYAAGADGLLGTADDVLVYDSGGGVMLPSDDKIEITVGPATLEVMKGQTLAMTASATFNSEDVTGGVGWTLVGNYAAGTSIAGSGANATLTVGASEGNAVTVRVSHQGTNGEGGGATGATNGNTKDVTVTVKSGPAAGEEFTDNNGVVWRVLAQEGDKKLIMTKYVYGVDTKYNTTAVWNHLDTSGNNLKSALQTWYTDTAGTDIKAAAVPYVTPLADYRTAYNTPAAFNAAENQAAGYSHPQASGAVTANGSNAIFVLSISEANQYLGSAQAGKIAYDASSTGTAKHWWLRSPGTQGSCVSNVNTSGGIIGNTAAYFTVRGFRPALWVQG